eukprot:SAG25_NODE_972_length_4478_cov_3.653574_5_plen_105_part_01
MIDCQYSCSCNLLGWALRLLAKGLSLLAAVAMAQALQQSLLLLMLPPPNILHHPARPSPHPQRQGDATQEQRVLERVIDPIRRVLGSPHIYLRGGGGGPQPSPRD